MVFTTPNQLSLVLQKVRFLTLFGHLLAPKMLTFGTPWLPEGAKSAPRGLPKAHPKKNSQKMHFEVPEEPVSAREREARFYFGALADQLACIIEKLEERILRFLKQLSNTLQPRYSILYYTMLCCAILNCTMLYYAMLCNAMLYFAGLC